MNLKIKLKVKPYSRQQKIDRAADESLIVYLKSPPIDGKANQELIKLLAEYYQVTKAQIKIKSGFSAKHKIIEID